MRADPLHLRVGTPSSADKPLSGTEDLYPWSTEVEPEPAREQSHSITPFPESPINGFYDLRILDPELLERVTARRAELDELEEQLAKQLAKVRAERDELAVAERVLERVSEQIADERAETAPVPGHVGGQVVRLIPHRAAGVEETALPPDYQRILPAVRQATGQVMARQVGEMVGWMSACGPSWSRCAES
ncbi:hypothetical protein [Streptomyces albipurpureus]|uniref:Uncharacterized protein n=1 Tax=Streptomyces albipurpureus TaxID=2897419 RepID=A0ABT0UIL8_9ACTN|nr:hypothetical protein [Streptomyces sp. CWNU-1]MCM2388171.1 hypothetical protein [Streptomyces sp. CWNU-1]